ncbi:diguanylate cyclase domain-containing protein [Nitrincola sp. MINF-07-Sa-05]|uniref:diguanylate cyclase domain-containing protein n=1 Tax=Nitrincola salilacus TaxID=3400273 RepID=UPI003917F564
MNTHFTAKPLLPSLRATLNKAHLSVALIAVGLASLLLTLIALLALRVYAEHNLQLIARSVSYTVEAAVIFHDEEAAYEALTLIVATEEVANAHVTDREGKLLARWEKPSQGLFDQAGRLMANLMQPPVQVPIAQGRRILGQVYVTGSGGSLLSFLVSGLLGMIICMTISIMSAYHLSRRMQGNITRPLRKLVSVAHAVRYDRDFSQRVPRASIAELNELGDDFNELLDELEQWQKHLKRENEHLTRKATHDSLTGLPNRLYFEGRLKQAVRDAIEHDQQLAVFYLDSNGFKKINDTLGHAAGDAVLTTVAARVKAQLRSEDVVARLGGDEFAVVINPLNDTADAFIIAENILASMNDPIRIPDGRIIPTSLSLGVAIYPTHGRTANALLHSADKAMYTAKRNKQGGWQLADPVATENSYQETLSAEQKHTQTFI